jgi:hypothetical protein
MRRQNSQDALQLKVFISQHGSKDIAKQILQKEESDTRRQEQFISAQILQQQDHIKSRLQTRRARSVSRPREGLAE